MLKSRGIFRRVRPKNSSELAFPPTLTGREFHRRCYRYLRSQGWTVVEDIIGRPIVRRGKIVARIFLLGPNEELTRTLQMDVDEARIHNSSPLGIVMYRSVGEEATKYALEKKIALCNYKELDRLEERCRWVLTQPLHYLDKQFVGVVDGFDLPSTLRGWVKLLGANGLVDGLVLSVVKNGEVVAVGSPDHPRPDITDSNSFPSGFRINCNNLISAEDFVRGKISVFATDADGVVYSLSIWDRITSLVRGRIGLAADKSLGKTEIAKLLDGSP